MRQKGCDLAMNTPNKLTVLRVVLIPIFMIFYLSGREWSVYAALIVFGLAAATDRLDGKLARKYNQITTFGKLMDPLADKILIMSALICFVQKDIKYIGAGVVMVILARELLVTGIRTLAMGENTVIAASPWGKAKTVSQFILVISVMVFEAVEFHLPQFGGMFNSITLVIVVAVVLLTVYSGWDYIWKNRSLLTFK